MCMQLLAMNAEYADFLRDESRREGWAEAIVFPTSTQEVCEALAVARENRWAVTVQGGRTGITGGCVPSGGLILNCSRMNTIGPIDGERITVQPGAVLSDVRAALQGSGLFFPSDPTETSASIGGMVANNASGARSFKYGSARNWIDALEVVLTSGEVVRVERGVHIADGFSFQLGSFSGELPPIPHPAVKNAAGYFIQPNMDLLDLFIGAEGTLGMVTSITLRLLPEPSELTGLTAFFASESDALQFVRSLRAKTNPIAIEFFDCHTLELLLRMKNEVAAFAELPLLAPEYHTAVYFEYEGAVPNSLETLIEPALECWMAEGSQEIGALKHFRHAVPESINLLIAERKKVIPELTKLGTDMSVPDEQLENVMRMYHAGLADAGLEYVIFGHIGNNHLHVNILPRSMEEYELGKALYFNWARQVVDWGGSVSAEHGIGKLKTEFLELMLGRENLRKMEDLKHLFDPSNLLNPGNLFERKI
ncbi:MAG: FAD-binding oxidoreductase [Lentisphaerae bacterium]|nr:FAD-binding oxidoreductase [Lentisphaerota bacterium]